MIKIIIEKYFGFYPQRGLVEHLFFRGLTRAEKNEVISIFDRELF